MEVLASATTPFFTSYPKVQRNNGKPCADVFVPNVFSSWGCSSSLITCNARALCISLRCSPALSPVPSDEGDIKVSSSQLEEFSVVSSTTTDGKEIKMSLEVSGAKTQAVFDSVFSKMVADAQPIPGFRRVKGGKTPNIPRDILLEILGPSNVYKKVIKKVINSAVAEAVEKEGLKVSKGLRVEQGLEDLEASFEPGDQFCFDVVLGLRQTS